MADITGLYKHRSPEVVLLLLAKASSLAQEKTEISWHQIQTELNIGYGEAVIILDWLADNSAVRPKISNHWIRSGRTYVLNTPFPDLAGMAKMVRVGDQRAYIIMQALAKRGVIRIKPDFSFERIPRLASFASLVRQMRRVAKKYDGRCEPRLLIHVMYVDAMTAIRLAQYGEENFGLRWKHREHQKELM